MLDLEKSLVYFTTSLRGNEVVLEKLMRNTSIPRYEDDEELLEDVIIENKQAIEMAKIYSDILSGTMDAFASVISNNLKYCDEVFVSYYHCAYCTNDCYKCAWYERSRNSICE